MRVVRIGTKLVTNHHGTHIPPPVQEEVQRHLARIGGQVRGLQRMLKDDRYCVDLLTQIEAVRGALRQVSQIILRNYLENCVTRAIREGDAKVYEELLYLINRLNKE